MLTLTLTRQYVPVFKPYHAKPGYPFLKAMHGSRKFCQRGSKLDVFLVDEGIEDPNITINGPSSARQRSAMFRWRAPMMAQH